MSAVNARPRFNANSIRHPTHSARSAPVNSKVRSNATAASARFTGVTVPDAAQWILPGVEYNKGSYWRVYGSTLNYAAGGRSGSFTIASMISWRGQWYVVHLASIR